LCVACRLVSVVIKGQVFSPLIFFVCAGFRV